MLFLISHAVAFLINVLYVALLILPAYLPATVSASFTSDLSN